MIDAIKKSLPYAFLFLIGAWAGFYIGTQFYPRIEVQTTEIDKPIIVEGKAQTVTRTEIAYVPKETTIIKYIDAITGKEVTAEQRETVDFDAQIGKSEFVVRLNGKDTVYHKADDEAYLFDSNKLMLSQSSTVTIDARVEPQVVDDTRRWEIGIGYGKHGVAYKVDFPLGNSNDWGGWIYRDDENRVGGIALRF